MTIFKAILNPNAMLADLPVKVVLAIFKVGQKGDPTLQSFDLCKSYWAEPSVLEGTGLKRVGATIKTRMLS
jgi:hypothetical protein